MFLPNLTTEQKAKRYDVLQDALLEFLEKKIADAKYDDPETKETNILDDWIYAVDDSALLPEDIYYLLDTILNEQYMAYKGEGVSTIKYLKEKYNNFMKKIEV